MEFYFEDKTFLVTGAGQGIGNGICKALHKYGAKVIAVSRSLEPLEALKEECPGIEIISVDVAGWMETREALMDVPLLDGLVNNAGISTPKPFSQYTESDFDAHSDVNFKAVFNICQFLSPKIKDGGSIVNVSSLASKIGFPTLSIYGPLKAALDNFAKNLAVELAPRKIRVNNINPTVVMTRMGQDLLPDPAFAEAFCASHPLGRVAELHEVVEPTLFLLSERSSFITGTSMLIDGGYAAQ